MILGILFCILCFGGILYEATTNYPYKDTGILPRIGSGMALFALLGLIIYAAVFIGKIAPW